MTARTRVRLRIAAIAVVLSFGLHHLWREAVLTGLTQGGELRHSTPFVDPAVRQARAQRARRLYRLWRERQGRDIVPEALPFLDDEYGVLGTAAARILGRLEDPRARSVLRTKLGQVPNGHVPIQWAVADPLEVSRTTLVLAVARIDARNLRGRDRVDALARSMELHDSSDLSLLSQRVNDPEIRRHSNGSSGREAIEETVDLLCVMRRRGEDVGPLVTSLVLTPQQQLRLQAAALSPAQEVDTLLNYLSNRNLFTGEDLELAYRHLLCSGPDALDRTLAQLKYMRAHRRIFLQPNAYKALFRAVALSGESRTLPLLKRFEQDPDPWVRSLAQDAERTVSNGTAFPLCP